MFLNFVLCISLPFLAFASPSLRDTTSSVVVELTSGSFRGVSTAAPNNTDKWLGIPFAQPPVGNLRFKAPVAITHTSKIVQDASHFGDVCPQPASDTLGAPISENCLVLNVSVLRFG